MMNVCFNKFSINTSLFVSLLPCKDTLPNKGLCNQIKVYFTKPNQQFLFFLFCKILIIITQKSIF